MCGIAAILGQPAVDEDVVRRMTERLRHRGPDEQKVVILKGAALGHTRLSIIDLAGGKQPMSDSTGRYWLIFNGEIYNYREIRRALEKENSTFRTNSDTETLLQVCIKWGKTGIRKLNGQFAFLFWDDEKRQAFGARDRMGEKPFFYLERAGVMYLASEIKSLECTPKFRPEICVNKLDTFFAMDYIPTETTIYRDIKQLRPGHILSYQNGRVQLERYWEPGYETRNDIGEREAAKETRRLFKTAVERQMIADVPIGAFLSGGLDSSAIVAVMAGISSKPVETFSVGFGDLLSELPSAKTVADKYGTNHHELQMDIPLKEMIARMGEVYDQPLADSANIPTYLVSSFARKHVKVSLAGEGGDELFCGYWWHEQLSRMAWGAENVIDLQAWRAVLIATKLIKAVGIKANRLEALAVAKVIGANERKNGADVWARALELATQVCGDGEWKQRVLKNAFQNLENSFEPSVARNSPAAISEFDFRIYLAGNILNKVDSASMAASLEVRSPMLDAELVDFVLSLPWKFRFKPGQSKPLLKRACADLWPDRLIHRKKQGFGAPVLSWVEQPDVVMLGKKYTRNGSQLADIYPGIAQDYDSFEPQQKWRTISLGAWLENRSVTLAA